MKFATPIILFAITISTCAGYDETKLAMNMYSNQLAKQPGDLLTIVISEKSSSSKSEALSTGKEENATAAIPVIGSSTGDKLSRFLNDIEIPAYSVSGKSSFKGTGSSSTADSFAATLTSRVMDVHENGLLVIRGERLVETKDETVLIVLTGLVRPRDISATNSINSQNISDFKVSYQTQGEVTKGTRPGWFWRIFQFLNPF